MKDLLIIKFGGSSITKKSENKFEMNHEVLAVAAKELASAQKKKTQKIILICGVGPFGHTNVVNYNLNNGVSTEEQLNGVRITNRACDFVAEEVEKALKVEGIQTKLIPGYSVCIQNNKKVVSYNAEEYIKALENGFIPITSGVMVKDESMNWSVMSGDQALAQLCKQLKPKKVLIGTDVGGIYSADPKVDPKAKLIPSITKTNIKKILKNVGESKSVDVTGGMKGKLEKLAETLGGAPAQIFNLFEPKTLENALLGKKISCTKIKL